MNINRLNATAQEGDVSLLYRLIAEDPYILERIDSVPFVETPLHIAASFGQFNFAIEVMRLKPSFAWKPNPQGFSPIHLAMQQDQKRMVLGFVNINKDLVRVKWREGLTPLHFASQTGDVNLLARFLSACPESIEDVTVTSETALHMAVKSQQYEALQVLVGWLKTTRDKDTMKLEETILNAKDEEGNTILHISAFNNDLQAVRLLVKTTKVDLNAKNVENKTALDMAPNAEIRSILRGAGAKCSSSDKQRSIIIKVMEQILIPILRIRRDMSEEQRSAYLVVVSFLVTATFQSALSPPGGVYQANAGDNSTATATQRNAGASVMSQADFSVFSASSTFSLLVSTAMIVMLTPIGTVGVLLASQVFLVLCNYLYSMKVISPTFAISRFYYILFYIYLSIFSSLFIIGICWTLVRLVRKVRNSYNIWLARKQLMISQQLNINS